MLIQRLISALILVPIILMAILYSSLTAFWLGITIVVILAALEWSKIFTTTPSIKLIYIILMITSCYLLPWLVPFTQTILFSSSIFWLVIFASVILFNQQPQSSWVSFLQNTNGALVGLALSFIMFIPMGLALFLFKANNFEWMLITSLIMVWSVDTGAYISGKCFGGKKLIPNVSPTKTWSGALGGVLFLVMVNLIVYYSFVSVLNNISFLILSLLTIVVYFYAVFGDLAESMFKRIGRIKDSGALIPGHGGILDRIDSIIPVLPIYWLIIDLIK